MRTRGWVLGLVFAAVAVAACARTERPELRGGETNWLRSCSDDTDCDLGSCLCGVCTTTCEGATDCEGDFTGRCIGADSRIGSVACDGPARVAALCLPDCTDDRACGDGFACRDGTCVTDEVAADVDQPDIEVVQGLCMLRPCASDSPSCSGLNMARLLVPPCFAPGLTPFYEAKCGSYHAIVEQGTDSAVVHYYDASGRAAGKSESGLGASSCTAYYEPRFSPVDCENVTPMCSATDGGVRPDDAGEGGDAETAACMITEAPRCGSDDAPICTLAGVRALVPECWSREALPPYREVRCGEYTGIVAQGTDSRRTLFYDASGVLVGENEEGLSARGCTAYDPTFRLSACEMVTPECPDPVCDCSAEEVSLECVCSFLDCPTYEEATESPFCQGGNPNPSLIARGCGMIQVSLSAGLSSRSFVYEGPNQELAGASFTDDVPLGECGRNGYRTALPNLEACDDYAVCALCEFSGYETCGLEP